MPARKRRSFGSIKEVVKGRKYIVRWVENTDAGRSRRSKTLRCTAAEASRFLALKEVEHGTERRMPTVGEAVELWYLPWLARRVDAGAVKQRSADLYRSVWRNVGAPRWSPVPIDRIKPADWQSWLLEQKRANATYVSIVMRKTLDIAVRNDVLKENVLRRQYDMPVKQEQRKTRDVYGLPKARAALDALKGSPAEAPVLLMLFGGLRVGESLGVRCDEVGEAEALGVRFAVVPVRRRLSQKGRAPMPDGDLKTPQSLRDALVPEPWASRLLELRDSSRCEWLAGMPDGWPMSHAVLRQRYRAAVGSLAIPLSNLRASWRTICAYEWQVPSETLEVLMGHALPGVSGRHYIRPSTEDLMRSFASAYAQHLGDAREI